MEDPILTKLTKIESEVSEIKNCLLGTFEKRGCLSKCALTETALGEQSMKIDRLEHRTSYLVWGFIIIGCGSGSFEIIKLLAGKI